MKLHCKLFTVFLFSLSATYGQNTLNLKEYPHKDSVYKEISKADRLKLETARNREALEEVYEWRLQYLERLFATNAIVYDSGLYAYIQHIFEQIKESNPDLVPLKLRFYVSNSPIPNAFSLGNGTFIINLALLRRLDNEAQLAFVLCHELGHYYLEHSNQQAVEAYHLKQSKAYQKEVKSILRQRYGKYESVKDFLKKGLYHQMTYSRQQEQEADSIGLCFLLKTPYNPHQSIAALNQFDRMDSYKYKEKIAYKEKLSFEGFPFKTRWLEQETTLFGGQVIDNGDLHADSVKSHPDIDKRVALLAQELHAAGARPLNNFVQDSLYYTKLEKQLDYAFINSWVFYQDYARALFFTLKQLESDSGNMTLLVTASSLFKLIYESILHHEPSKYIEHPDPANEEEFNTFLVFLDNIRLVELGKMGYFFHAAYSGHLTEDETFANNYNFFYNITNNQK